MFQIARMTTRILAPVNLLLHASMLSCEYRDLIGVLIAVVHRCTVLTGIQQIVCRKTSRTFKKFDGLFSDSQAC